MLTSLLPLTATEMLTISEVQDTAVAKNLRDSEEESAKHASLTTHWTYDLTTKSRTPLGASIVCCEGKINNERAS
jgi:hypothetical protein